MIINELIDNLIEDSVYISGNARINNENRQFGIRKLEIGKEFMFTTALTLDVEKLWRYGKYGSLMPTYLTTRDNGTETVNRNCGNYDERVTCSFGKLIFGNCYYDCIDLTLSNIVFEVIRGFEYNSASIKQTRLGM